MYAAAYGETKSALILVRYGANPFAFNEKQKYFVDYALVRGHLQLLVDISNYYFKENQDEYAKRILDLALYRYIIRADGFIRDLQDLLKLGAQPRWTTKEGNTIFHFVKHSEHVALLLEFGTVPLDSKNSFGHTPLMVLSWFLDISIVRQILATGVSTHERDNLGRTALEHVLLAGDLSELWLEIAYEPSKFQEQFVKKILVAFELLAAGINIENRDICTCFCSLQGCTILRCLLPNIYSNCVKELNIAGIPWAIELFMFLRKSQKEKLPFLVKSLHRRHRFEELGLSHTCCLSRRDTLFCSTYSCPHDSAIRAECRNNNHKIPLRILDEERIEELLDEQEELGNLLADECKSFEDGTQWSTLVCESSLLNILGRRAVFIERGLQVTAQTRFSRWRQANKKPTLRQEVSLAFTSELEGLD
jgi:hypothetical protein